MISVVGVSMFGLVLFDILLELFGIVVIFKLFKAGLIQVLRYWKYTKPGGHYLHSPSIRYLGYKQMHFWPV